MKRLVACVAVAVSGSFDPAWADFDVGMRLLRRGDVVQAYDELKESAEAGHVLAARALGQMLERGVQIQGGARIDPRLPEAAQWYRKAAEGGDKISAELLAAMYATGRGVTHDPREALKWFAAGGRQPTPQILDAVAQHDPAERDLMLAWALALELGTARGLSYPRDARRAGDQGLVWLRFHASEGTVEILDKTDAAESLRAATLAAAQSALAFTQAPPPARARALTFDLCVNYRFR